METLAALALALLSPLVFSGPQGAETAKAVTPPDLIETTTPIETETRFSHREEIVTSSIPFKTEYRENSGVEYGTLTTIQEGVKGVLKETYLISLWNGEEIGRDLIKTEREEPTSKIVEKGTKVVWKELPTKDQGLLQYWAKLNVRATSYDGDCDGCRGLTYSGTLVKVGVCATDPKVIPLGTNFYVPGYGVCRAEDIGGAIKGNAVDLGFEDVHFGWWSTRYVDVYLLSNSPEERDE